METPLRMEKRSSAPRSMDFGSSHPDLAATLRAPTVTSMCNAVRNVTYLYPSVLIRYLFTMTIETEDATLRVSAPTVPISIGLLDDAMSPTTDVPKRSLAGQRFCLRVPRPDRKPPREAL